MISIPGGSSGGGTGGGPSRPGPGIGAGLSGSGASPAAPSALPTPLSPAPQPAAPGHPVARAAPPAVSLPRAAPSAAPPIINIPGAPAAPPPAISLYGAPAAAPPLIHDRGAAAAPLVDLAGEADGTANPGKAADVTMPAQLIEKLRNIQDWAAQNKKESRYERFLFWSLKIPVIAASAGTTIMVNYGLDKLLVFVAALSGICVLVDGLARPGSMRNFHHKAYFELTTLVDSIDAQWQRGTLNHKADRTALAEKLFDQIIAKSKEVADYLTEVETADTGSAKADRKQGKG